MLLAAPPPPPPAIAELAQGDHDFAANLYKAALRPSGNLFLSPTSIRLALAMAATGAVGGTADEMHKVLELSSDTKKNEANFSALLQEWNDLAKRAPDDAEPWQKQNASHESIELHVVNRLWGQAGHKFHKHFLSTLSTSYRAPLEELDFAHATEASRLKINAWVAGQTANKIQDLIGPGVLLPASRLVLTNAIYFKAAWSHEFNKGSTVPMDFTAAGKTTQVPTMQGTLSLNYAEVDQAKVISLPYADGSLSMVVVLPDANDGLAAIESGLTGASFDRWMTALSSPQRIRLSMPKFKTESAFQLAGALQSMGMKAAFNKDQADFSGMDGTHELFIGDVLHKAFIDVNEEGTEAAAATAVMMVAGAAMRHEDPPKVVKVDHPFFFIRDTRSGSILFAGRVTDPAAP